MSTKIYAVRLHEIRLLKNTIVRFTLTAPIGVHTYKGR